MKQLIFDERKFLYAFIFIMVTGRACDTQLVHNVNTSSLAFNLHTIYNGVVFWIFCAISIWAALIETKKKRIISYAFAFLFLISAVCFFCFPFYSYNETVKADKRIAILQKQTDSLRKLGK